MITSLRGFIYDYKAKAWNDGPYAYLNRCWCRVEMMYAANIPLCRDISGRKQHFKAGLDAAVKAKRRPHYLYGTSEKMKYLPPHALPPLRNIFFRQYDPMNGSITKESDRQKIEELIEALQPYINEAVVGYVGDRDDSSFIGLRHGQGTETYESGDVYVGEWKFDKICGQGTLTYACGNIYNHRHYHHYLTIITVIII